MHLSALPLSPAERRLTAVLLALCLAAVALPALPQAADYHAFADQSRLGGLPHAWDVLSNLGFAVVGVALLQAVWRMPRAALPPVESGLLAAAGVGSLLTALASAGYHVAPDDAGLVLDRSAMVLPFAAVTGLAACRVSERAGLLLAACMLCGGLGAVAAWAGHGNLWPWVVAQGGGALLVAGLSAVRAPGGLPVHWGAVLGLYALAKLFEMADHMVWEALSGAVSGHALKHLLAAAALLPLVRALRLHSPTRQNASRHDGARTC